MGKEKINGMQLLSRAIIRNDLLSHRSEFCKNERLLPGIAKAETPSGYCHQYLSFNCHMA